MNECRKLFLIDAYNGDDQENVHLMFKDMKTNEVEWIELPRNHYFLLKYPNGHMVDILYADTSHSELPKRIKKGYTFEVTKDNLKESTFRVVHCNVSNEDRVLENMAKQYPDYKVYDSHQDPLLRILREENIRLYGTYDVNRAEEYQKLDEFDQSALPTMVIDIKTQKSLHQMGAIPRIDPFHIAALRRPPPEIKACGLQKITSIRCLYEKNADKEQEEITFDGKDELAIIRNFIAYFTKKNPDRVWMYNWTKMYYLYQRTLWYEETKVASYLPSLLLDTLNRVPTSKRNQETGCTEAPKFTRELLEEFCFPLYKVQGKYKNYKTGHRVQTRTFLDLSDNSNAYKKFSFRCALLGRITLGLYAFDTNKYDDLFVKDTLDLKKLYTEISEKGHCELMCKLTGENLNLPYRYFKSKLTICYNLIRKYNPNVFFPGSTSVYKSGKMKVKGGKQFTGEFKRFVAGKKVMVDFGSYYPELMRKFNLCKTTCVSENPNESYSFLKDLEKVEYGEGSRDVIFMIPKTTRIGATPNTITQLLIERNACKTMIAVHKKQLDDTDSEFTTKELKVLLMRAQIAETAVKLECNTIFGASGCQIGSNPLAFPKITSAITYHGRSYWDKLALAFEANGMSLCFGDTDGMIVQTKKSEAEILEVIKTFQKTYGDHLLPAIKEEFKAVIVFNKKCWVALEKIPMRTIVGEKRKEIGDNSVTIRVQPTDLVKFVNKGVITKMKPLMHRTFLKNVLEYIMLGSIISVDGYVGKVEEILKELTDISQLDLRTQFKVSLACPKTIEYINSMNAMCSDAQKYAELFVYGDERVKINDKLKKIFDTWQLTFGLTTK